MITSFIKKSYVFFALMMLTACDPFALKQSNGRLDYYMFPTLQHKITPYAPTEQEVSEQPYVEKNYSIGTQNVAYIGQPMVSFRMNVQRDTNFVRYDKVRPTEDVVLKGGAEEIYISKDVIYDLIGTMVVDGETFDVMQIKDDEGVLITKNSTFSGRVVRLKSGRVHVINYIYVPFPANTMIVQAVAEHGVDHMTLSDFEIIYSGIRNNKFYITLMDNTHNVYAPNFSDGSFQSGIYQTFAYDKNTSLISVGGVDIRILGIHSDKIDYIVINDPVVNNNIATVPYMNP
ncbi:MAG: hypothetical protein AB7U85_09745 [Alphaproteobacteria bacterium]